MRTVTILAVVGWVSVATLAPRSTRGDDAIIDLRSHALNQALVKPSSAAHGAIAVTFNKADWPGVNFKLREPADWSRLGFVALELENPGPRPIQLHVRIDDAPEADGVHHCRTAHLTIRPHSAGKYAVDFTILPPDRGMRGRPGPAGYQVVAAQGEANLDVSHIVALLLFLNHPAQTESLVVRSATLVPPVPIREIVDRFGQYAKADWPGKLHDEGEFASRRSAEKANLAAHPAMPDRDRFGGWASGPTRKATGFFRVEQIDGVWWLVDPDGRLFFSAGIDCVGHEAATRLAGRETWFEWLPEPDSPLSAFYGRSGRAIRGTVGDGRTFDFYTANLRRKYGPAFETAWRDAALRRLPSWGFNTIGNWSDRALYRNGRIPYVATGGVRGDHARISSGSDYWGQMHDPFDPKFAENVRRSLQPTADAVRGDPWCVGVFVDNELSWGGGPVEGGRYGLALGALAAKPGSPAHAALLGRLHGKYETIDRLNAAWGSSLADWAALENGGFTPKAPYSQAVKADLAAFVTELSRRYFQTINHTLKQLDPDHLYLGCRFAWRTSETVKAAAEVCDVVSFNIYQRKVDSREWAILNELGKPAIIGEFHVGALDRGMFHTGLVESADQNERAATFAGYVGSVLDNPALVGCHWFQWVDQPLTGRALDGENYNIGFLTVTDTPYPEMVAAAREIHQNMYARRASLRPRARSASSGQ